MTIKQRTVTRLGIFLIVIGLAIGYSQIAGFIKEPQAAAITPDQALANNTSTPVAPQRIEGNPVRLQISSLGIDLPVVKGYYNSTAKTWSLSNDKAHFATITPQPNNQEGNTFIYGHNRKEVFSRLNKIQPDQTIIISTDNGHVFTYKFIGAYETNPNDDRLFSYHGAPILTVQTCSGIWYQNRQLFRFDLVSVT